MARTSGRRWKGCQLCKPHKNASLGRAVRDTWQARRKLGSKRRAGRHDIPADQTASFVERYYNPRLVGPE